MKKGLLVLLAIGTACTVSAQTRFGIKAGVNISNMSLQASYMGEKHKSDGNSIANFHLGGVAEIPLSKTFSFRPELLLSGKGSDMSGSTTTGDPTKVKMRPLYLEVPLNIVFHNTLVNGNRVFVGAGPYLAYGIGGKAKAMGEREDFFQEGAFRRFDAGINSLIGFEFKAGVTISANYAAGLANTYDGPSDTGDGVTGIKFRNSVFGISVGYMFARK